MHNYDFAKNEVRVGALEKAITALTDKITSQAAEIEELRYQPGGPGFLEALNFEHKIK